MQLDFVKMEGLGNDFMVAEWPHDMPPLDRGQVVAWADRRSGIGFDSLLLIDRAEKDISYRVLNADGSEAQQCGNGVRCVARYLSGGSPARMTLKSLGGAIAIEVLADGNVRVNLGEPDFRPAALPFNATAPGPEHRLGLPGGDVRFRICSMGNPHAVIEVDAVDRAPVAELGAAMAASGAFPQGINVGFAERVDAGNLRLRVFERGVGETRACGTGAAAAMAVGRLAGEHDENVTVSLPGGKLAVSWRGPGHDLWQTGPARTVFEGTIDV